MFCCCAINTCLVGVIYLSSSRIGILAISLLVMLPFYLHYKYFSSYKTYRPFSAAGEAAECISFSIVRESCKLEKNQFPRRIMASKESLSFALSWNT